MSKISDGDAAQRLLEDETLQAAFQYVRDDIIKSWPNEMDQDKREKLWMELQLFDRVKQRLTDVVRTGIFERQMHE